MPLSEDSCSPFRWFIRWSFLWQTFNTVCPFALVLGTESLLLPTAFSRLASNGCRGVEFADWDWKMQHRGCDCIGPIGNLQMSCSAVLPAQFCSLKGFSLLHFFAFCPSWCLLFFSLSPRPSPPSLSPLLLLLPFVAVAALVSVAPPPPPMVQLTPQIPLTGFVARMQESSEYLTQTLHRCAPNAKR